MTTTTATARLGRAAMAAAFTLSAVTAPAWAQSTAQDPKEDPSNLIITDHLEDSFFPVTTYDSSGEPAFDAAPGQWIGYVQSGMAYDSPADANYITVVDVATREVLTQVAVPMPDGYQSHGLGASADGRYLYVPSLPRDSSLLHVLDGRTLKLAQTIDVGARTHHVDEGTYKATDRFVMVDVGDPVVGAALLDPNDENRVIGTIPWYVTGGRPYSAWSDPTGRYAYVTVRPHVRTMNSWISKVDLETMEEVQAYEIGYGAVWVAFSADGTRAWVTNTGAIAPVQAPSSVMEVALGQDGRDDEVVATVELEMAPYGIVLNADASKLYIVGKTYVDDPENNKVFVLNTATKEVVKMIEVGIQPDHLFLTPDGSEVWVAENRGNAITIIDVATDTVTGNIPMPGDTHSVRFVRF